VIEAQEHGALRPLSMPTNVRIAMWLLWTAWAISLGLTIFNHFLLLSGLQQRGVSELAILRSFAGLLVQGIAIYFVGRGSSAARVVFVILMIIAALPFVFIMKFMSQFSLLSVSLSVLGYILKVVAIVLLFSAAARPWFQARD
jgi:hypothetical protein